MYNEICYLQGRLCCRICWRTYRAQHCRRTREQICHGRIKGLLHVLFQNKWKALLVSTATKYFIAKPVIKRDEIILICF